MSVIIEKHSEGHGTLADGCAELRPKDRNNLLVGVHVFGEMLLPGRHSALSWADAILTRFPNSPAAKRFAYYLIEISQRYSLPDECRVAPAFIEHATNLSGRDWVVGDLHGQYELLMSALDKAGFCRNRDRLFQVGDLIDRGPDSLKCLSLVFEPWFFGCLGNHERLALDALREGKESDAWSLWFANGGHWIYGEDTGEVRQLLLEAARHLPLAREVPVGGVRFGLMHAEPPADWDRMRAKPEIYVENALWGRDRFRAREHLTVSGIDAVVVGHNLVESPSWLGNVLHIETGAFRADGCLTLFPLDSLHLPFRTSPVHH